MLRLALLLLCLAAPAWAGGTMPAVNSDMGCTVAGQAVQYSGSVLTCAAPTRPTTVIGSLPSCVSGLRGQMYIVTDALTPVALAAVAAGGVIVVGVTCTGSAWIVQ